MDERIWEPWKDSRKSSSKPCLWFQDVSFATALRKIQGPTFSPPSQTLLRFHEDVSNFNFGNCTDAEAADLKIVLTLYKAHPQKCWGFFYGNVIYVYLMWKKNGELLYPKLLVTSEFPTSWEPETTISINFTHLRDPEKQEHWISLDYTYLYMTYFPHFPTIQESEDNREG